MVNNLSLYRKLLNFRIRFFALTETPLNFGEDTTFPPKGEGLYLALWKSICMCFHILPITVF